MVAASGSWVYYELVKNIAFLSIGKNTVATIGQIAELKAAIFIRRGRS